MQIDFVIFHLRCRTSRIKVPLLSNDLSERTCLAICPTQGELLRSLNFWLRKTEPYPSNIFGLIKMDRTGARNKKHLLGGMLSLEEIKVWADAIDPARTIYLQSKGFVEGILNRI